MRIILDIDSPDDGILALRAAKYLWNSDRKEWVYAFEDGRSFWVKRTKSGVSSTMLDGKQGSPEYRVGS